MRRKSPRSPQKALNAGAADKSGGGRWPGHPSPPSGPVSRSSFPFPLLPAAFLLCRAAQGRPPQCPKPGGAVEWPRRPREQPHSLAGLRCVRWAQVAGRARVRFAPNSTPKVRAHGGAWGPARPGLLGGASVRACAPRAGGRIPRAERARMVGVINYSALGLRPPTPGGGWRGCPAGFICTQWK